MNLFFLRETKTLNLTSQTLVTKNKLDALQIPTMQSSKCIECGLQRIQCLDPLKSTLYALQSSTVLIVYHTQSYMKSKHIFVWISSATLDICKVKQCTDVYKSCIVLHIIQTYLFGFYVSLCQQRVHSENESSILQCFAVHSYIHYIVQGYANDRNIFECLIDRKIRHTLWWRVHRAFHERRK